MLTASAPAMKSPLTAPAGRCRRSRRSHRCPPRESRCVVENDPDAVALDRNGSVDRLELLDLREQTGASVCQRERRVARVADLRCRAAETAARARRWPTSATHLRDELLPVAFGRGVAPMGLDRSGREQAHRRAQEPSRRRAAVRPSVSPSVVDCTAVDGTAVGAGLCAAAGRGIARTRRRRRWR